MQTVLLVEDNAGDEALTLRALRKNGLANRVDVTRDGAEALDYLFRHGAYVDRDASETPTVVLLDLNLPKVGGLEVLSRIRGDARTKLQPVVILTSSDEERDYLAGYQNGANSYVRKPVEFNDFAAVVQKLGLYWLSLNRNPPSGFVSRSLAAT